jgi:hypothetical protein
MGLKAHIVVIDFLNLMSYTFLRFRKSISHRATNFDNQTAGSEPDNRSSEEKGPNGEREPTGNG